ncbi:tetratricopeptide repeat protein, partial [Nostoc sp. CHAB 5834]|nr:tetratricopeptide repeat protein [Nostoc sp. CHAB 5834]
MSTAQEYYNQGCLHLEDQDFVEAILKFDQAVELNPADYIIYAKRGSAYFALGNYRKSVDDYSEALELNFAFIVGFNNRGVAHRELGNYREAILDFTMAAEWGPDLKSMASSYHNRAITYYLIGDFDKALADLAWAIGFDPNNAIFYSDRGMIKSTQGNLKEGLMDYELAITIDPMYANAYTGRAITYIRLKNYQAADNDFTRAVGLALQKPIHPSDFRSLVKNVLIFFYEKSPHPYLAKCIINNYKIGNIFSYSNLIYQTQSQCAVIDRYQLYLEKVRGLRQTQAFEFISMQALVHFYMGDPGEAFRLYNDVLDIDYTINLQGQYYFLRSASAFQESEESQRNIRKDATKQADIFFQKFDLLKATANNIKELYYAGQIFFTAEDYSK